MDTRKFRKKHRLDIYAACSMVSPEMIKQLHGENLEINCRTCDDPSKDEQLAAMDVDYITTNMPE